MSPTARTRDCEDFQDQDFPIIRTQKLEASELQALYGEEREETSSPEGDQHTETDGGGDGVSEFTYLAGQSPHTHLRRPSADTHSLSHTHLRRQVFFSNRVYYSKLEELKRAHLKNISDLQKLYLHHTDHPDHPDHTHSEQVAPRPNVSPHQRIMDLEQPECVFTDECVSEQEDDPEWRKQVEQHTEQQDHPTLTEPPPERKWCPYLNSTSFRRPANRQPARAETRRRGSKVTTPEPFQMTLREKEKKLRGVKTRSEVELENERLRKELEEVRECSRKFRASPAPPTTHTPLYEVINMRHSWGPPAKETQGHLYHLEKVSQQNCLQDKTLQGYYLQDKVSQGQYLQDKVSQQNCLLDKMSQGYRLQDKVSQGYRLQDKASQGYCLQDKASQGHYVQEKPSQGYRLQDKATQGHYVQEKPSQRHHVQEKPSQGYRLQDKAFQGYRLQDKGSQGYRLQDKVSQGYRVQDKASQGYRLQDKASQGYHLQDKASQRYRLQSKRRHVPPVPQKPFSFIERERKKKEKKLQEKLNVVTPREERRVFKARPVPRSLYHRDSPDFQLYGAISLNSRAQEHQLTPTAPPGGLEESLQEEEEESLQEEEESLQEEEEGWREKKMEKEMEREKNGEKERDWNYIHPLRRASDNHEMLTTNKPDYISV